jgi:hypothetical protein
MYHIGGVLAKAEHATALVESDTQDAELLFRRDYFQRSSGGWDTVVVEDPESITVRIEINDKPCACLPPIVTQNADVYAHLLYPL